MPKLEAYLESLAREARGTMSPTETVAFVAEAREHLEASIQARLELGMSLDEAERESLAGFGTAHTIGQEVRRREPRFDKGFALAFLGTAAFVLATYSLPSMGRIWFAALAVYAALHVALVVTSLRAHRPQWAIFVAVLLPIWLGAATSRAMTEVTVFYPNTQGGSTLARAELAQTARRSDERAQGSLTAFDELIDARLRYRTGESDLGFGGYSLMDGRGHLRLRPQPNRALGEAEWNRRFSLGLRAIEHTGQEYWRRARIEEAAIGRPWWLELPYQLGPAFDRIGVLQVLFLYGGGHFVLWAVGRRARRRQARSDPLTPA